MKSIGVGVIGVGKMGTIHARAYTALPDAELVGVADADVSRAQSVAGQLDVRAFENADQLLADSRIEAVSICTNDESHVNPTLAALKAQMHVLLEKPIATNLDDADCILSAASGNSRCFLVGHILRFAPRYAAAKKAVEEGRIGDVISIFARRINAASSQDILKGRVSVLSFLGVHDFDLCHWITGSPPQRVHCEARYGLHTSHGYNIEDQAFTVLRFENGAIACVESGWVLPETHPRKADLRMEIMGTTGVINIDLMSQGMTICNAEGYRFANFGHGIEYELDHFLRCVRGEERPGITGQEARCALEMSLGAQKAAASGEVVTFPLS